MAHPATEVNEVVSLTPTIANLINVSLALEAAEVGMNRPGHLPGMITYTGHSGLGKSFAVTYVAQLLRGFYVEFMDNWTQKEFIKMIMFVMGIKRTKEMNDNDCIQAIISELGACGRPLIIDEFDQLIDRKYISDSLMKLVLNIAKRSCGTVILVGEELLPHKIAHFEKFDNCIYARYLALPSELSDSRILARHYYPDLEIRDDLLDLTVRKCKGITRRICMNLDAFAVEAAALGIDSIGLTEWGTRSVNTFEASKPRSLK